MAPRPPFTGTVLSGSAGPQVMEGRRPGVASCPLRTGDISSIHPMRASPSPQHRRTRDQDAGSGTGHLWHPLYVPRAALCALPALERARRRGAGGTER